MRGTTQTVRGKRDEWPDAQSKIWKRNASAADLEVARRHVGKTIQLTRRYGEQPPPYRIASVRLDSLNRLIADLVLPEGFHGTIND